MNSQVETPHSDHWILPPITPDGHHPGHYMTMKQLHTTENNNISAPDQHLTVATFGNCDSCRYNVLYVLSWFIVCKKCVEKHSHDVWIYSFSCHISLLLSKQICYFVRQYCMLIMCSVKSRNKLQCVESDLKIKAVCRM